MSFDTGKPSADAAWLASQFSLIRRATDERRSLDYQALLEPLLALDNAASRIQAAGREAWSAGELLQAETAFLCLAQCAHRLNDDRLRQRAYLCLAGVRRELEDGVQAAQAQQLALSYGAPLMPAGRAAGCDSLQDADDGSNCDGPVISDPCLGELGCDALFAGNFILAERLLLTSLAWETSSGSLPGQAADWGNLGLLALQAGRPAAARVRFLRALGLHHALQDPRGMGCDWLHLADLAASEGRIEDAISHVRRACVNFEQAPHLRLLQIAQAFLAHLEGSSAISSFDVSRN